jgi:hypothetical protein
VTLYGTQIRAICSSAIQPVMLFLVVTAYLLRCCISPHVCAPLLLPYVCVGGGGKDDEAITSVVPKMHV